MGELLKPYTLAIDTGGTGLKMVVLDKNANFVTERDKVETPDLATPTAVVDIFKQMIKKQGVFERVSAGFPGVVINGVVKTAPNLDKTWHDYDLQKVLHEITKKPARVINDADMQGYGDIDGKGVELVITLGTGFGSALFTGGHLVPNLELGHHPFKKNKTYEELLGKKALEKFGKKKWNEHLIEAINLLANIFNYQTLYIGGGNNKNINFDLPSNVRITDNIAGLLGGVKLWNI